MSIKATSGPALVGGDIGAFVAKYSQPNDHTDVKSGSYHFQRYAGSNVDAVIVQTDITDGNAYTQLVDGVTAQAPDTGWNQHDASFTCAAFFPRDAVYKRQVVLSNGYDKIYYSASLAKLFPALAFTDVNGNQVTPGSFDVLYLYKSGTTIDSCDGLVGASQTQ